MGTSAGFRTRLVRKRSASGTVIDENPYPNAPLTIAAPKVMATRAIWYASMGRRNENSYVWPLRMQLPNPNAQSPTTPNSQFPKGAENDWALGVGRWELAWALGVGLGVGSWLGRWELAWKLGVGLEVGSGLGV